MIYKSKHSKKAKVKKTLIVIPIMIISLGIVLFNFVTKIKLSINKDDSTSSIQAENLETLNNSNVYNLITRYYTNPNINGILSNIDKYPDSLLKLALNNPETISFVSNYTKHLYDESIETMSIEGDYKSSEIPLFLQWDERWGYDIYGDNFIAINGCAPTSLAMVISGLTEDNSINPKEICDYSFENGFYVDTIGSSWTLVPNAINDFGLTCTELPLSESAILSTLEKGNPIVVTVGPGTFTSFGHFLVLTGVTEDNKIKINDPNSKINSSKTWDIEVFLNECKNLWAISY
ncbi:MAG: C39 family peptidase [Peptostreptococcaceae bacterium]